MIVINIISVNHLSLVNYMHKYLFFITILFSLNVFSFSPINQPQTTFYMTSTDKYKFKIKVGSNEIPEKEHSSNGFGYDYEVPVYNWLNAGISLQAIWNFTSFQKFLNEGDARLSSVFSPYFRIRKPFKIKNSWINFFTRIDLGFGTFMEGAKFSNDSPLYIFMGILLTTTTSLGVELYVNKWFGLVLSYNYKIDTGVDYITKRTHHTIDDNVFLSSQENVILLGLKTTFI